MRGVQDAKEWNTLISPGSRNSAGSNHCEHLQIQPEIKEKNRCNSMNREVNTFCKNDKMERLT